MRQSFSHRQARSTPIIVTLAMLVILETGGVHLLLLRYSLLLALAVSLLSLTALVWLIADYLALGRLATIITDESLILRVGRRAKATIPLKLLATAITPSWRDLPDAPDGSYLNVTKPAEPNVLLSFTEPVVINLPGGLRRSIRMLALFVDTPGAFLSALRNGRESLTDRQPDNSF